MSVAVRLENVTKSFALRSRKSGLKHLLLHPSEWRGKNRKERINPVLRGVNLRIEQGESVGITGRNGSGKSSLLGIIGRVLFPDSGSVQVHGKVGMMLELGAGFAPELSGRENILVNGVMQGARRREILRKMDEIVAFSGLERFIDSPIFTYSSGMLARLGFAVMTHLSLDILLVDEVLAVGDGDFHARCLERIQFLQNNGVTLILVSHNSNEIETFCSRCWHLEDGVAVLQPCGRNRKNGNGG